jgi:hypothetical protein
MSKTRWNAIQISVLICPRQGHEFEPSIGVEKADGSPEAGARPAIRVIHENVVGHSRPFKSPTQIKSFWARWTGSTRDFS